MNQRDRDLRNLAYWDALVTADAWTLANLVPQPDASMAAQAGVSAELAIAKAKAGIGWDDAPDWGG